MGLENLIYGKKLNSVIYVTCQLLHTRLIFKPPKTPEYKA